MPPRPGDPGHSSLLPLPAASTYYTPAPGGAGVLIRCTGGAAALSGFVFVSHTHGGRNLIVPYGTNFDRRRLRPTMTYPV